MKFYATAAILLAGSVVAASGHSSIERSDGHANIIHKTRATETVLTTNWGGAVLSDTGYTEVTAKFKVPTLKSPGKGNAWIAIDGESCDTVMLQTGIGWELSAPGQDAKYSALYQWYPGPIKEFSTAKITIKANDVIKVTITSTTNVHGIVKIENISTGQTVSYTFEGSAAKVPLCNENASWFIERAEENKKPVEFADFDTFSFTDASAVQNGARVGLNDADVYILALADETPITSVSLKGDNGVTIKHIGA